MLVHPDPELQFVVEVDASDSEVGAILSKHSPADQKLHPCGFFFPPSHVERNCDVENQLLAVFWLSRNSDIGFMVWSILSLSGQIIKTCLIFDLPADLILTRLVGLWFLSRFN